MKLSKRMLIGAITLVLLAVTVIPAFAAEYNLTIHNKTGGDVKLILRGPTDVEITITKATTILRGMEEGTYNYRYTACGLKVTGTFKITTSGGRNLTIKKCEKSPNGTILIDNRTGRNFILRLIGPARYNINIDPGKHAITVVAGRYSYSVLACGTTQIGDKGIKSKNNPDWVWTCN